MTYLKRLEDAQVAMPVRDIRVGTLFLGDPVAPCGPWPGRSASLGEQLWIRTPNGVANFSPNLGYDGQADMSTWIVDGYVPIDGNPIAVALSLKKDLANLMFYAKTHTRRAKPCERV